jgi:hypothetical protein
MSAFEDYIQLELPRRPWSPNDPAQETVPVRRGAGPRQLDFVELTDGQVLGKLAGTVQGITISGLGGDPVPKNYVHVEDGSPVTNTWIINHNQNSEDYVIVIYDEDGDVIIPDQVNLIDANTIHVIMSFPIKGKAVIVFAS